MEVSAKFKLGRFSSTARTDRGIFTKTRERRRHRNREAEEEPYTSPRRRRRIIRTNARTKKRRVSRNHSGFNEESDSCFPHFFSFFVPFFYLLSLRNPTRKNAVSRFPIAIPRNYPLRPSYTRLIGRSPPLQYRCAQYGFHLFPVFYPAPREHHTVSVFQNTPLLAPK